MWDIKKYSKSIRNSQRQQNLKIGIQNLANHGGEIV